MQNITSTNDLDNWVDQKLFIEQHPQFSTGQINWVIRNRKLNGLEESGAVRLFGRKMYIHKGHFSDWFSTRKPKSDR